MSYDLIGNWKAGWALDIHTLSSVIQPDGSFENVRSEIGEALFQLKYRQDYNQIDYLAGQTVKFLRTRLVLPYINVIMPTPASQTRLRQPVHEITQKVCAELNIPYDDSFIQKTRNTSQLKEITDLAQRQAMIEGAFEIVDSEKYRNKKVLVIDDLFRSGTTLNELCKVLYESVGVNNVYIVTLTKTRSNK